MTVIGTFAIIIAVFIGLIAGFLLASYFLILWLRDEGLTVRRGHIVSIESP